MLRLLCWVLLGAGSLGAEEAPPTVEPLNRLTLVNIRNLSFSPGFQGDPPETVPPLRGGPENAALFMIQGRPHMAVLVLIPDSTVILTTSSRERGARNLRVRRLRSSPEAGEPFQLDARGLSAVAVGGTRDSVAPNQASGDYEGRFFVTVMYQ